MTDKERKSCIRTIELLRGLAFRVLGVMDIIDAQNCDEIIKMLEKSEAQIKPISYTDCSNAMLKMWMDNVLTDGEYNRIMDKINAKHMAERRTDERFNQQAGGN